MTAQTERRSDDLGDEAGFGALFDRHSRAVDNHAFRLTGMRADLLRATRPRPPAGDGSVRTVIYGTPGGKCVPAGRWGR